MNRPAMLGHIAGAAALTLPAAAIAAVPADPDAEIVALGAEIVRRCAEAQLFQKTRIDAYDEQCQMILDDYSKSRSDRLEEAWTFSEECGRTAAIEALEECEMAMDRLFYRLMTIPAMMQPGRAAKVRAFLVHILGDWRGPASHLEWDVGTARALLGEFAGMSAAELAAI